MPSGRTVLLLRRLSTGDNRLKSINLNQNTVKEPLVTNPVCTHRDLGFPKRLSTFGPNSIGVPQLTRSFSENKITMAFSSSGTSDKETPKHTNRLITEKSPYLLQHAHNPVQWYPWCQEAFDIAKAENKVIFLSIGYSTCHWCHVMETESFENEDTAKIMNEHFINIKVDREERPDIDQVYMLFILATSGGGGWPMSVFLTPDLRPITGGTYFPPEDRFGKPGFKTILLAIAKKWKSEQKQFLDTSNKVMDALQKIVIDSDGDSSNSVPGDVTWEKCVLQYKSRYESEFGGFGTAPKFPQASIFNFLFHYYARDKNHPEGKICLDMCLHTLKKIANGGIHDHVSGGFARYSVDNEWHVPHFEKMLYDQAQLTVAYTDAFLATKDKFYAEVVQDIIKYVKRDLRHESGGFYSAEDADSYPEFGAPHKKEGAFCTLEYEHIKYILKEMNWDNTPYLDIFCDYFGVEEDGNIGPDSDPHDELTHKNILIVYGSKEDTAQKFNLTVENVDQVLSECIDLLYEARQKRPQPHLDTKMLCSWNGLMIAGLAQAGQGLGEKDYVADAITTAEFIKKYLYNDSTKTLLHSCYRADDGSIAQTDQPIQGFLDDYAFLIKGLLDLYEASLEYRWLEWARDLQLKQNELFWDETSGGYFASPEDSNVVLRLKPDHDGAEPSGNSVSCHNLLRLAVYADKSTAPDGGDKERTLAKQLLKAFANRLNTAPTALPEMMSALMFYNDSPTQVLIAGGSTDPRTLELVRVVRSRLLPGRVLCVADPTESAAELYRRESVLWNPEHRQHKDKNKVSDEWNHTGDAMGIPIDDLKRKKETLITAFLTNLKKKKDSIKSGTGFDEIYTPSWPFFDVMESFLNDVMNTKDGATTSPQNKDSRTHSVNFENRNPNIKTEYSHIINPVQRRRSTNPPELQETNKEIGKAVSSSNSVLRKRQTKDSEDDCDLYGQLLATKLRQFTDIEKQELMYEIDGILLKKRQKYLSRQRIGRYVVQPSGPIILTTYRSVSVSTRTSSTPHASQTNIARPSPSFSRYSTSTTANDTDQPPSNHTVNSPPYSYAYGNLTSDEEFPV